MAQFINYAHRGASAFAPENTMAAFKEALSQGADAIECDIQMSRDGIPIVIHDEFLERTTNGTGFVHQWDYKDLKELDAGSWFSRKYSSQKIPTLQELLEWIKDTQLHLNIELKPGMVEQKRLEESVIDLLHQYRLKDRTVISSYDLRTLYRIRKLDPKIETALLYFYLNEPWKYAEAIQASSLHAFYPFITQETIMRAKQKGISLIPYTVDEWSDLGRVLRLDVSGVITNYPNRVRRYLAYNQKTEK